MAGSIQLAAALSEQDTQLSDVGIQSVVYRVEVAERGRRRCCGTRIQGVGDFAEIRQLRLLSDDTR